MTRLSVTAIVETPTGASEGSCCVVVRWRTADGDKTRLSFEKHGRKYVLQLASAAVVRDCVGDRIVEL